VLCLTSCGGCAASSFGRDSLGVGGSILLMSDCIGEEEEDFVGVFDRGVDLGGLGGGNGMVVVA